MYFLFRNRLMYFSLNIPQELASSFPSLKKLIKGNTKDFADKLTALEALGVPTEGTTWDEPFGGVGASAALASYHGMTVTINELSPELVGYLKGAYPEVTCQNALSMDMKKTACRFYDPSNFTFNHLCAAFSRALKTTQQTMFYTDVFPYSMKPFDCCKLKGYLKKCSGYLFNEGWFIQGIYLYRSRNAMVVKIERKEPALAFSIIDGRAYTDVVQISLGKGLL